MLYNNKQPLKNVCEEEISKGVVEQPIFFKTPLSRCKCNLKELRIAKGWTQSDLSREVGFTPQFINMVEHQKVDPILETKIKIAKALVCDTSAIWVVEDAN